MINDFSVFCRASSSSGSSTTRVHRDRRPGFPFCPPDQGLYTPTRLSARQISSSHVVPLPAEAALDVEPTRAPAFRPFLRHRSTLMLFLRRSSAVSGRPLSSRHWQRPEPPQHVAEQPTGQMPFRQQEPVVSRMLHQAAPGLHQPLLETRERPALDPRPGDARVRARPVICTNGPPESRQPPPVQSVRCRHRNGRPQWAQTVRLRWIRCRRQNRAEHADGRRLSATSSCQ